MADFEDYEENHTGAMRKLSKGFLFYGRAGFWVQFVLLIVVAILGIYTFSTIGGRARLGNLFAALGLALPIFTTFWCWHYGRVGRTLADAPDYYEPATLGKKAWVGVLMGLAGMTVSLLSLFAAASAMMLVMLSNPQIGIQVSPANVGASVYTISAVDAVSIMSLLVTLVAEMFVVAISMRLVFLATSASRQSVA